MLLQSLFSSNLGFQFNLKHIMVASPLIVFELDASGSQSPGELTKGTDA